MKMCGFEAKKGPESSPELRPKHYHGISLPCFLRPMGKAVLGRPADSEMLGVGSYVGEA